MTYGCLSCWRNIWFRHLTKKVSSNWRLATTGISVGARLLGLGDEDEAGAVGLRNTNAVVTEISGALIPPLVLG